MPDAIPAPKYNKYMRTILFPTPPPQNLQYGTHGALKPPKRVWPEAGPEILEEIIFDRVFFIQHWLNDAEVHVLDLELVGVPAACA